MTTTAMAKKLRKAAREWMERVQEPVFPIFIQRYDEAIAESLVEGELYYPLNRAEEIILHPDGRLALVVREDSSPAIREVEGEERRRLLQLVVDEFSNHDQVWAILDACETRRRALRRLAGIPEDPPPGPDSSLCVHPDRDWKSSDWFLSVQGEVVLREFPEEELWIFLAWPS